MLYISDGNDCHLTSNFVVELNKCSANEATQVIKINGNAPLQSIEFVYCKNHRIAEGGMFSATSHQSVGCASSRAQSNTKHLGDVC